MLSEVTTLPSRLDDIEATDEETGSDDDDDGRSNSPPAPATLAGSVKVKRQSSISQVQINVLPVVLKRIADEPV